MAVPHVHLDVPGCTLGHTRAITIFGSVTRKIYSITFVNCEYEMHSMSEGESLLVQGGPDRTPPRPEVNEGGKWVSNNRFSP